MNESPTSEPVVRRGARGVLIEAGLVALIGLALAFLVNAISPLGLSLRRNYFPGGNKEAVSAAAPVGAMQITGGTSESTTTDAVTAQIHEKGLQAADHDQVLKLFHDPRYQQGLVVFIDARDPEHYRSGHIPGALEYDPYRPEKYLATVLPACQAAEQVVVYCNGGDCEDSQFAAVALREAGIANDKLNVYEGGITDWRKSGLQIETGERTSREIQQQK